MPDSTPHSPALLRTTLLGLVGGAALGVVEVGVWMRGSTAPSLLRRSAALAWDEAAALALLGAAVFLVAGLAARVAARRRWRTAREGALPVAAAAVFAQLLALAALVGLGERLARQSVTIRAFLLLLVAVASCLAGWCVARRLARRPGGRIARTLRSSRIALLSFLLLLGILASRALLSPAKTPQPLADATTASSTAPDVLLILIDTLRADALGAYGSQAHTPNLDALAASGTLFEDALAPSSWTLPAMGSLFTSTQPWQHGLDDFGKHIDPDLPTLPELLSAAGWHTRAVVGNPFVNESTGFARGFDLFDVYDHEFERRFIVSRLFGAALAVTGIYRDPGRALLARISPRPPFLSTHLSFYVLDEDVNERLHAFAWPAPREGRGPTFLYAHFVAPHTPYLAHPLPLVKKGLALEERNLDALRARYRGEVEATDRAIGELLEDLRADGALEHTVVIVAADHGEEFLEHGQFEHGHGLHREVLHVPLLVSGPGIAAGRRIARSVSLLDLAPTVLEFAGVPAPESFLGKSLLPDLEGSASAPKNPDRLFYSEVSSQSLTPSKRFFAVQNSSHKLIRERSLEGTLLREEAFDIGTDPAERTALTSSADTADPLAEALNAYEALAASHRSTSGGEVSDEELERMNALGYVNTDKD